jgi:hypothetical protein
VGQGPRGAHGAGPSVEEGIAVMRELDQQIAPAGDHLYRLDLARWWVLLHEHLAHPSADTAVLAWDANRELVLRSGWDWAGMKSTLDQIMAVATTQLLEEIGPAPHAAAQSSDDD